MFLTVASMLALGTTGACASGPATVGSSAHGPSTRSVSVPSMASAPPAPTAAAVSPQVPLSARIVLPATTMATGSTMDGQVIVENNTGHALHPFGCLTLFEVVLHNAQVPADIAGFDCYGNLPTIPVGESTWPMPVSATYFMCGMSGPPNQCINGRPPPLPLGLYEASLYQMASTNIPDPPSIVVRLIAGSGPPPSIRLR